MFSPPFLSFPFPLSLTLTPSPSLLMDRLVHEDAQDWDKMLTPTNLFCGDEGLHF